MNGLENSFDVDSELEQFRVVAAKAQDQVLKRWIGKQLVEYWEQIRQEQLESARVYAEKKQTTESALKSLANKMAIEKQEGEECEGELSRLAVQLERVRMDIDVKLREREQMEPELQAARTTRDRLALELKNEQARLAAITEVVRGSLKMYSDKLGFKLRRVKGPSGDMCMEFQFTSIDSKEPARMFVIALKIRPDKTIVATDCQPRVADLGVLLDRLNKTNDWHSFVVVLRRRFVQLV